LIESARKLTSAASPRDFTSAMIAATAASTSAETSRLAEKGRERLRKAGVARPKPLRHHVTALLPSP
jgi:hypothetical protein